jgi:hypothetical protein
MTKKGLVEWLNVKALSSGPSPHTQKKKVEEKKIKMVKSL